VAIQNITEDLAQSFELESLDGVIISNIIRNGPADQAGLTRGDVITQINGSAVKNVRSALTLISQAKPGSTVKISGIRQGKKLEVDATVMQRPRQD
jgi:S1-C subfamily serine protease